nr:hypothetical protein GCM10020185_30440 [Pseudomonas brassicacearum subsp. brassicacearum]
MLIEHFRQHASAEPPASLDAFILAAARREAPTPAPSLWQRWLQACQRPRWQMAFATVAGVALMIGLVLRSPVTHDELSAPASMEFSADRQAPAVAAAPPPAMPAPAPIIRMAPQGELARAPASPDQTLAEKVGGENEQTRARCTAIVGARLAGDTALARGGREQGC